MHSFDSLKTESELGFLASSKLIPYFEKQNNIRITKNNFVVGEPGKMGKRVLTLKQVK